MKLTETALNLLVREILQELVTYVDIIAETETGIVLNSIVELDFK